MKRAAIIGMGDIYPIHMAAIQADPQITLCAVCDSDEAKEGQAPQGVPFYRRRNRTVFIYVFPITCITR